MLRALTRTQNFPQSLNARSRANMVAIYVITKAEFQYIIYTKIISYVVSQIVLYTLIRSKNVLQSLDVKSRADLVARSSGGKLH